MSATAFGLTDRNRELLDCCSWESLPTARICASKADRAALTDAARLISLRYQPTRQRGSEPENGDTARRPIADRAATRRRQAPSLFTFLAGHRSSLRACVPGFRGISSLRSGIPRTRHSGTPGRYRFLSPEGKKNCWWRGRNRDGQQHEVARAGRRVRRAC